ncbi:MAG: hypothetical protein WAO20_22310 [Acidobacteriota bacterium]
MTTRSLRRSFLSQSAVPGGSEPTKPETQMLRYLKPSGIVELQKI